MVSLPKCPPKFISVILTGILAVKGNLSGRSIFILATADVYNKNKETLYLS
jgi:hypothetical protein